MCRAAGLALLAYGVVTGYAAAIMAGTGLLLAPALAGAYRDEDSEPAEERAPLHEPDPIDLLREQFATDQLSLEAFEDAVAVELAREEAP